MLSQYVVEAERYITEDACNLARDVCVPFTMPYVGEHIAAGYPFTSITVNCNYASKPHRDSCHIDGRARIIAIGDFEGGELWVEGQCNQTQKYL